MRQEKEITVKPLFVANSIIFTVNKTAGPFNQASNYLNEFRKGKISLICVRFSTRLVKCKKKFLTTLPTFIPIFKSTRSSI